MMLWQFMLIALFFGVLGSLIGNLAWLACKLGWNAYKAYKTNKEELCKYSCDCGGYFKPTGMMYPTSPLQEERRCSACNKQKGFV